FVPWRFLITGAGAFAAAGARFPLLPFFGAKTKFELELAFDGDAIKLFDSHGPFQVQPRADGPVVRAEFGDDDFFIGRHGAKTGFDEKERPETEKDRHGDPDDGKQASF